MNRVPSQPEHAAAALTSGRDKDAARHVWFETFARSRSGHAQRVRPGCHEGMCHFYYVASGNAEVEVAEQRWLAAAPGLMLVPAWLPHGVTWSRDASGYLVGVPEARLLDLGQRNPDTEVLMNGPRWVPVPDGRLARRELASIGAALRRELASSAPARDLALEAHLIRLIVGATRLCAEPVSGPAPRRRGDAALVARFREIAEAQLRVGVPIARYAATLGVSEGRLRAACRRATGRSPLAVVHDRVVAKAKRDLLATTMSVAEIAFALGFNDALYFSRFFHRHVGETASEFRRRHHPAVPAAEAAVHGG